MKVILRIGIVLLMLINVSACQLASLISKGVSDVRGQWIDSSGVIYTVEQVEFELKIKNSRSSKEVTGQVALFGFIKRAPSSQLGGAIYVSGTVAPDNKTIVWNGGETWWRTPTDFDGIDKDTRRIGESYKEFDLQAFEPALCREVCKEDPDCFSFSVSPPAASSVSDKPHCYLHDTVPEAFSRSGYFSGVMQFRIDENKPRRIVRHFVSLDQVDVLDTNESGEDEIYVRVEVDSTGFYPGQLISDRNQSSKPLVRSMNEDSDKRYWYPALRWEFSQSITIQLWEDDEILVSKTFDSRDLDGSDYSEIFGLIEIPYHQRDHREPYEPEHPDGLYRVAFTKGPIYKDERPTRYTNVIEDVTTISTASGIEKGVAQEIIATTDLASQINMYAGYLDPTKGTEFLGYALDVTNITTSVILVVDDALDADDQLQVRLDGVKIWPTDARQYTDSATGDINRVFHAEANASESILEIFDFDSDSDKDSLGQVFLNSTVVPRMNDPRTIMVYGDADEASIYRVRSRLYEDAAVEFCKQYRGREISLMGQQGFAHGKPNGDALHLLPYAGQAHPESIWKVECETDGTVRFRPNPLSSNKTMFGNDLGVKGWTPLNLLGTDRWAFRATGSGGKNGYLWGIEKELKLDQRIDKWAQFTIKVVGKPPKDIPLNTPIQLKLALQDACLAGPSTPTDSTDVKVVQPCTGGNTNWRFELAEGDKHGFAYRIRFDGHGETPLYLINDSEEENLQFSDCANWPDGCFWYIDRSWNLTKTDTFYLRSAQKDFRGVTTYLFDPRERLYRKQNRGWEPRDGEVSKYPLLSSAPASTDGCFRYDNQPDCQWRIVAK